MSETVTYKAMTEQNLLKQTLESSLFHSFYAAGYDPVESAKLVNISISLVSHALDLAHRAYQLHLEAINTGLITYKVPSHGQ